MASVYAERSDHVRTAFWLRHRRSLAVFAARDKLKSETISDSNGRVPVLGFGDVNALAGRDDVGCAKRRRRDDILHASLDREMRTPPPRRPRARRATPPAARAFEQRCGDSAARPAMHVVERIRRPA